MKISVFYASYSSEHEISGTSWEKLFKMVQVSLKLKGELIRFEEVKGQQQCDLTLLHPLIPPDTAQLKHSSPQDISAKMNLQWSQHRVDVWQLCAPVWRLEMKKCVMENECYEWPILPLSSTDQQRRAFTSTCDLLVTVMPPHNMWKKRNSQHGSSFTLFSWPDEDPLKKKSFIKHKSAETGMRKPYAANISMHIKIRPWQTIWLLSCTAQLFFFFFKPGGSLMLHQWIHISEVCASQAHLLAVRQPLWTLIRFVFYRLRCLGPERA